MYKDKTVVITGASSGAGRAMAEAFAGLKYTLVLASRNLETLSAVAEECKALGAVVHCIPTDVTDAEAMKSLAASAVELTGHLDVWINNAGVLAAGPFDETPIEVHEQVIRTNLLGYLNGAHATIPWFKKQRSGILINNISIGGFLPVPYGVGYSASKFGLRGFSAALKSELISWRDIHVCDLFPAFLDSPGIQHAGNYTGKVLKPAPPVYDPRRVAMAAVRLAEKPQAEVMVGSIASILRLTYGLFPRITRGVVNGVISSYLKTADRMPDTNGNLFQPANFGTSIHGGWGAPGKPKAHRKFIMAGLVGIAAISYLLIRSEGRKM